jgi:hypothetical protein
VAKASSKPGKSGGNGNAGNGKSNGKGPKK